MEYCNENIKDVYHELFDEALARYNEKQTRSDRRIDDYYEKICSGKQEKPFHEIILQIGNKDDMGAKTEDGQLAAKILDEYMQDFQRRNPTLRVFSAHLHMDEATPHLHIEVAELEQTISGSREELSDILHQQIAAGQETEQIRKEGEAIRQEVSELTATNHLLKEQKETLTEDKEKLLSENEKLEKQQKKLQQELNKMVQSKEVMERNIHAYDEDVKWQLAEPGALMSAKNYRDKKALPLVEKLKEVVKNLTIKCVQLTEQSRKLTAKVDGQQKQISRLTDKVMEQSDTIDRLQEKVSDLGRLERHLGREQVQSIVERSKVLEQAERAIKRPKRAFEMSR